MNTALMVDESDPDLQKYYKKIERMSKKIGVAKQARLRAVVNKAWREGKLDSINLGKLAKLSVKSISAFRNQL